jgi:heat shock protein HslJ
MTLVLVRVIALIAAIATLHPGIANSQEKVAAWLDKSNPDSWNKPGLSIPAAPKIQSTVDPKCRESARPPQLDEDKRLRDQGWDLVGAYQGGWQLLVIRGTAGYDGMCRPRQYQEFVFVRGQFAGTLSPQPMDSRGDGALARVSLQSGPELIAEYVRYAAKDPLCCPSRTTRVVFEIASDAVVARSASTFATETRVPPPGVGASRLEGTYWRATELAGKPTPAQDPKREAHLQFQAEGRVSGSDGCNRLTGSYQLKGDQVTFAQMVGTQMACLNPSGIEGPFRDALKRATRLTVTEDRLALLDATGTRLAVFAAGTQGSAASSSSGLAGTSWQLVKFEGGDDSTLTPDDGSKYTLEFSGDGRLIARVDCNRGRGTWKSSTPNQLEFGPLALTRAKCPAGSLHDQIVKQLGNIRSYVVRDGHLFLALMADGGIYEFEPVAKPKG